MIPEQHGFLVRLWHERGDVPGPRPVLRGMVDDLPSGLRRYVTDLHAIVEFIEARISGVILPAETNLTSKEMTMPKPAKNADVIRALDYEATRREMEETLLESSPVYTKQVDMMEEIYGTAKGRGGLTQKERILIALGMAVYSGPESAVDWTVTRALNHGANEEAIRDTIDIALLNGGTLTVARARFAYNALALRLHQRKSSPQRVRA